MRIVESKLRRVIREMIESEFIKGRIRDALNRSFLRRKLTDIDAFIDENSETWEEILKSGDSLKFLGSGRQGSAFQLGNFVLKLEPGAPRATEIEDALYFGTGAAGLPKVITSGTMDSPEGPIGWSILEKFEEAGSLSEDPDWNALWKLIRDGISSLVKSKKISFKDMDPAEVASELSLPNDLVYSVEEKFRLASDWLPKFLDGMQANYRLGMVDFKPDNMGIRRRGPEGYVVFFDAASAMKRDIKKWEALPAKKA